MDHSQKEYICEFFVLFSRLEYALKMVGHHKGEGNAKADWEKFGSAIEFEFRNDPPDEVTKHITYLTIDNPPN
jgi:hypothetical protein